MFIKKAVETVKETVGVGLEIPLGVTTESNGHIHTISNPASDFTDPAPDGHFHQLSCPPCQRTRYALRIGTWPTKFVKGHLHYFNSRTISNLTK